MQVGLAEERADHAHERAAGALLEHPPACAGDHPAARADEEHAPRLAPIRGAAGETLRVRVGEVRAVRLEVAQAGLAQEQALRGEAGNRDLRDVLSGEGIHRPESTD